MKIHCTTFQPKKLDRSLGGSPRVASALSGMYLETLGGTCQDPPCDEGRTVCVQTCPSALLRIVALDWDLITLGLLVGS